MLELLLVIQITQSIFSIKAAGRSLEQESQSKLEMGLVPS